ncbi:hypothetical protein AB6A40_004408 [Gnathostoma spinigerum]|uniref:Uncharacterized protein n=1 Tax=Gnathostoma spinigerum TaxID=75299 RepID=A0ABD6ECD5_9BILA
MYRTSNYVVWKPYNELDCRTNMVIHGQLCLIPLRKPETGDEVHQYTLIYTHLKKCKVTQGPPNNIIMNRSQSDEGTYISHIWLAPRWLPIICRLSAIDSTSFFRVIEQSQLLFYALLTKL